MKSIYICFIYMNIDISDLAFSLNVPELPKMPEISNIVPEVTETIKETIVESIPTAIEETIKSVIPESTLSKNNYMYIILGFGVFAIICIYIYYKNFRNKNKKVTFQDNVNTPSQPIMQQPMMQQPIRQQPIGQQHIGQTYQHY